MSETTSPTPGGGQVTRATLHREEVGNPATGMAVWRWLRGVAGVMFSPPDTFALGPAT